MGEYIWQAVHTSFADWENISVKNVTKRAKPVERSTSCNNIGMLAKKSNIESGKIYNFYLLGFLNL